MNADLSAMADLPAVDFHRCTPMSTVEDIHLLIDSFEPKTGEVSKAALETPDLSEDKKLLNNEWDTVIENVEWHEDVSKFYTCVEFTYQDEWTKLFETSECFDRLRFSAVTGLLRACRFRSICWRLYLKVLPEDQSTWYDTLQEARSQYVEIKNKVLCKPQQSIREDLLLNHPLSLANETPWKQYYKDKEERAQIKSDVRRLNYLNDDPAIHEFFHSKHIQKMMKHILFCCSKKNSAIGYFQGMHDILAVIIWVLRCDQEAFKNADESKHNLKFVSTLIVADLMNPENMESDAFSIFYQLMLVTVEWLGSDEFLDRQITSGARPRYTCSERPKRRMSECRSVIHKLWYIHDCLLQHFSPALVRHLKTFHAYPPVSGYRWLITLFSREFVHLDQVIMLWDGILADGADLDLVDYMFVALLLYFKDVIVESDEARCSTIVLDELPPDFNVSRFIVNARQLRNDYLNSCLLKSSSWENITAIDVDTAGQPAGKTGNKSSFQSSIFKTGPSNTQRFSEELKKFIFYPQPKLLETGTRTVELAAVSKTPMLLGTESFALEAELMQTKKKLCELQLICLRCAESVEMWTGKLQSDLSADRVNADTVKLAVCGLKEASFKLKMATSPSSFFHLIDPDEESDSRIEQPSEMPNS